MTDYHGFFWGLVIYFGLVPGLVGAGLFAVRAWQRGASSPARIAVGAAGGFVVAAVLCLLLVVAFLSY